jgi:hypothetical protein
VKKGKIMRNPKGSLKVGIAVVLLISSFNLTACGGRIKAATQVTPVSTTPGTNFYDDTTQQEQDYYPTTNYETSTIPTGTANIQSATFKVDQATFNQWQAKAIAVSSGTIYVAVSDTEGLSKKGSIVKMNSSDGKNWKDITSKLLGVSHPIASTVTGLTVSGGTIIATDSNSKVYSVDASKGSVKVIKTAGGTDVASGAGSVFIANGSVEKSDTTASLRTPITGLSASGGVGSDNLGNVYAVSGNTIKKADAQGQVFDVITTDLSSPVDVTVDSRSGDIYVLEQSTIKRFNSNGQLLVSFSNGATKAVSIATDESGALYVADAGSSYKDSKVIKFAPSVDAVMSSSNYSNSGYGTYGTTNSSNNSYGNNGYAVYSNTRR